MIGPRPASITAFKWLSLASLAMAFISVTTGWGHLMAAMPRGQSTTSTLFIMLIVYGAALLLLWFIVWRRSNAARWIYVVIHTPDLVFAVIRPATSLHWGAFWAVLTLGQYGCAALCLLLLFRQDSRDWFAGRGPVDPAVFS
jgi:hypothetical protein